MFCNQTYTIKTHTHTHNDTHTTKQIVNQVLVILGTIVKLDYPKEWSTLPNSLMDLLNASTQPVQQHRALLALLFVVKALQAKRTAESRAAFGALADSLFPIIFEIYGQVSEQLITLLHSLIASSSQKTPNEGIPDALLTPYTTLFQICQVCLRVLKKLIINTTSAITEHNVYGGFLGISLNRIDQYLEILPHLTSISDLPTDPRVIFTKIILAHQKSVLETQTHHPADFIPFLNTCLQFFARHILSAHDNNLPSLLQPFVLQSLTFFINIFNDDLYTESPADKQAISTVKNLIEGVGDNGDSSSSTLSYSWVTTPTTQQYIERELQRKEQQTLAASILTQFFTPSMISDLSKTLVIKYFRLTQEDMEAWNESPEQFMGESGGEIWKYSLRVSVSLCVYLLNLCNFF